jgi:CRISPR/Cas system endoribonuclease Cas6 (RAMP superfamily)
LWDIREESGGRKHLKTNHILSMKDLQFHGKIFHRRLNRWVFGIYEEYNGKYPSFEEVQDYKEMGLYYEKVPLVRINCKIEIGGSCVENNVLVESMHKNKTFLKP